MGWGVNDTDTYSFIMGLGTAAPIFNLAVSSYGTARELVRAKRHPEYKHAKCILIQYSKDDLKENEAFLSPAGLPSPTPERYEYLVGYHPTKLSFVEVVIKTSEYMVKYPLHFWTDLIGWRPVWWFVQLQSKSEGSHARTFLDVLRRFPELKDKTIFVMWLEFSEIAPTDLPANAIPINAGIGNGDFYTLDMHLNKAGHQEIARQVLEQMKQYKEGRECLSAQ